MFVRIAPRRCPRGASNREGDGRESVECPVPRLEVRGGRRLPVAVPSLTHEQTLDISRIGVRRYPVAESQGMIFVWAPGERGRRAG